jgi:hypothetical protein
MSKSWISPPHEVKLRQFFLSFLFLGFYGIFLHQHCRNFLLLEQENISCMEECQIPVWARDKMFRHQQGALSILISVIFQRRASF